ncbi:transposase [Streptomyces sp. NPDC007264]|uniref:transposase n=1 Tax=Streptomyces sp. NPDC007264 TaxID=3364777 RepID=UPI0036DD837C
MRVPLPQRDWRDRCDDSAVRDGVSVRPWIVDDALWALIEPLLPPWPQKAPGPKPVDDRLCLQSILYVLYNDVSWQLLPLEPGFGSGRTYSRRLGRWHEGGVFEKLHRLLLAERLPRPREKKGVRPPARRRSTAGRRAVNTT